MASDAVLKVGVAGLGFGSTEFMPTLERMPQIELVAAADSLRPHALRAFIDEDPLYAAWREPAAAHA